MRETEGEQAEESAKLHRCNASKAYSKCYSTQP